MPLCNRLALGLIQHSGKRAGLSKSARQRGIALQEVGDLGAREPCEDSVPFQKGGANLPSIPGHPAFEVGAGDFEHALVAAEPGCNLAILRRVDSVNHRV